MQELDDDGRLYFPPKVDGRIMRKVYLHELQGQPMTDLWSDISPVSAQHTERANYPTQKPEALLERIIQASSNEGDLVLDCFCGSGTTAAVAEKLGRRWITCDLGRFAIHTARKRLLGIEGVQPFVIQNLGKYERQVWQTAEFGADAAEVIRQYRQFILDLYHADRVENTAWLHGRKGRRLVHVGAVDSPVTPNDLTQIAIEYQKLVRGGMAGGVEGVDILGWDFAFETNETSKQRAQDANLSHRFYRIPREVLEKKAVEQGDIQFFELAALSVEVTTHHREATVRLTDFMVPPDDVPQDIASKISQWDAWIDYWAVDWDYRGDAFHNQWQTYRTRKDRTLLLSANHRYENAGTYTVLVKVIDIFGNDTTKAVEVIIN
jgi:SAM-dependent methyltransferase